MQPGRINKQLLAYAASHQGAINVLWCQELQQQHGGVHIPTTEVGSSAGDLVRSVSHFPVTSPRGAAIRARSSWSRKSRYKTHKEDV